MNLIKYFKRALKLIQDDKPDCNIKEKIDELYDDYDVKIIIATYENGKMIRLDSRLHDGKKFTCESLEDLQYYVKQYKKDNDDKQATH